MSDQLALNTHGGGEGDYITKMNQDNRSLEYFINLLLSSLTGQSIATLAVPQGLQQIFDRRGLIGVGSYDFSVGGSSITVAAGAYWSGTQFYCRTSSLALSMAGLATGTYYLNLDAAGNPLVSATADVTSIRQFYWDGTHTSALVGCAGVAILFDGDDYQGMLTSIARAKTFYTVAQRLEEIEQLLSKTVQTPAPADTINVNFALGSTVRVLLNRALTTFNFTGAYDGQRIVLELTQDGVGGRGVAFGAETIAGTDLTFPVALSTAPNKDDELGFIFNGTSGKYRYTSLARGFSA